MIPAGSMRREIAEIPAAAADLLGATRRETARAAAAFRAADPRWGMIVARGTSDHAAVYARYLLETKLGMPTGLAAPSVTTAYRASMRWAGGAVVAISQSGESPDVVEVAQAARAGGALTIAVTNQGASPLARAAQHVILCHAGREEAVPATKTYITQLVAIAGLVAAIARDRDLGRGLEALPPTLERAIEDSVAWLASLEPADSLTRALAAGGRALVVSRGFNLATAMEISLKLKETAGIFAEPYSAADLLHGPLALAGHGLPAIFIRPAGPVAASIDAARDAARARGAEVWQLGAVSASARGLPLADGLAEALTPIPFVLPGYLVAEEVAHLRGLDPDAPAGLHKVTHTR